MGWLGKARRQNARRRRGFWAAVTLLSLLWLGVGAAGVFAFILLLDRGPQDETIAGWFILVGSALVWWFNRYGPVEPMPGKTPEEHAAAAFFEKRDVRSDDHAFLPGDDPPARRA